MRPNLLYLVHRVPYPPDKGDRIRAYHLLRFLARRAAVHLACLADEPVADGTIATLRRHCERVAVVCLGRWTRWASALSSLGCGGTVTEGAFRSAGLDYASYYRTVPELADATATPDGVESLANRASKRFAPAT